MTSHPPTRSTDGSPVTSTVLRGLGLLARVGMRAAVAVRPTRESTTSCDIRMHCDTRDFVQRRVHYFGVFEHGLTAFVRETVEPGDTVIDVGANVGYVSLLAASRTGPTGEVLAIEADPTTYEALERNLALNPGLTVTTRQVAVTAERCRVSMRRTDPRNCGANAVEVTATGVVEGLPLPEIDLPALRAANLIKIDVEGAEGPVLDQILAELPRMSARLTVVAEIHEHTADRVGRFIDAGFDLFLLPNDYSVEEYLRQRWKPDPGRYALRAATSFEPGSHDFVFRRRASTGR